MNPLFLLGAALGAAILGTLIVWAMRGSSRKLGGRSALKVIIDGPKHLHHMPQIRQALDAADFAYVKAKGDAQLAAKLRRERLHVTILYLNAIRSDFEQALHIARVIAVLSPEISGAHEYERLKLTLLFRSRYQMVRLRLLMGDVALPQVALLGQMVTSLARDLEAAMAELGERAALAVELAAQSDR